MNIERIQRELPSRTHRLTARLVLAAVFALAGGTPALAQRYSLDPLSPEVGGAPFFFSAADVLFTPGGGPPQVILPAASLGLIAADNVDALSDGTDPMPPCVVAEYSLVQFSVDRATAGLPASAVWVQTLGNGAAGDTFQLVGVPSMCLLWAPPAIRRDSTSFGLTPNPPPGLLFESDIDALMRSPFGGDGPEPELVNWDVYFSVDPPTAARLTALPGGFLVTEADILYASNAEPWLHVYRTRAQLRLAAGDDVDGLVILDTSPGVFDPTAIIHISLTSGSPSAAGLGGGASMILVNPPLGPGSTSMVELGSGTFEVAATEEVDALMAGDPPLPPSCPPPQPPPAPPPPPENPVLQWSENFDSYALGSDINGQGGWFQWDGAPISDAFVDNTFSHSAPHALYTERNADKLQDFMGTYTTGYWEIHAWAYVPSTMIDPQWGVFLSDYHLGCGSTATCSWTAQFAYDPTTPQFFAQVGPSLCTGANQYNLTAPLVFDAWAEVVIKADLCGDTAQLYYNGAKVGDPFAWSSALGSGPGPLEIDAINLYASNNPTPGDRMYWDDMSETFASGPVPCCEGVSFDPGSCPVGVSSVDTGCCIPTIRGAGVPSASAPSGFRIDVFAAPNDKLGLVFYGHTNTCFVPIAWGGTSYLCVKAPTQRMPVANAGSIGGATCSGSYSIDWNAFMAAHPSMPFGGSGALGNPRMVGDLFDAQYWYRDPTAVKQTNLSGSLRFCLAP